MITSRTGVGWGAPWVRNTPAGWRVWRMRYGLGLSTVRNDDGGRDDLLSLSVARGVIRKEYADPSEARLGDELKKYWLVRPGQFVVNPMWLMHGSLGAAYVSGVISPDYRVYDPSADVEVRYLHYLLKTREYQELYGLLARGTTTYDRRISKDGFNDLPLLVPPLKRQQQIAEFLDVKTAAIDALIAKRECSVELMREKLDCLIQRAEAQPETEIARLGQVARKFSRPIVRDEDVEYVPIGLLNRARGIFLKPPTMGADLGDSSFHSVQAGDLIFSGQFAWEGSLAVAGPEHESCIASHRYHIVRADPQRADTAFLAAFFRTSRGRFLLEENSRGAAGRNRPLNFRRLLKEEVPVPPLALQREIGRQLLEERSLAALLDESATRLNEYRSSLISNVVTGKLDIAKADEVAA